MLTTVLKIVRMNSDKMNLSKKIFLVLLSVLSVASLPLLANQQAYAQTARVYLEPTPLQLNAVGATGTVEIRFEGLPEIAGFEFNIYFDKDIIQIEDVSLLVPPSEVTFWPFDNIRNNEGVVTVAGISVYDSSIGKFGNILSGTPAVLVTLTVSAIAEGTANLRFDTNSSFVLQTEVDAEGLALRTDTAFTNGQVKVGETPAEGPTINLSSGGNQIVWPSGLTGFTSLTTLEGLETDCGGAPTISRKKSGWWESAVYNYGGADFNLSEGGGYYIKVASACTWTP